LKNSENTGESKYNKFGATFLLLYQVFQQQLSSPGTTQNSTSPPDRVGRRRLMGAIGHCFGLYGNPAYQHLSMPRAVGRQWDGSMLWVPSGATRSHRGLVKMLRCLRGSASSLCAFSMVLFIQQRQGT
ncbi:hypothetical protein DV515_00012239, partial [Chloebia gouldiae]